MPKKLLQIFLVCLLLLIAQIASGSSPKQIQSSINWILKKYNPNINVGIMVQSLTRNTTLYQKNANQLFMPASVLKVFPAVAALSFLGPEFQFQTKILAKNITIDRGVINDNLYFYFDGDPSLTSENIADLIKNLTTLGINTINGNIYIDDSIFDDSLSGAGWVWDDLTSCYAAPISAIMIDKNCFPLKLAAGQNPQQLAVITSKTNQISVTNKVISKNPADAKCAIKLRNLNNNDYLLSGCIKTNAPPMDLFVAVHNVRLYAKNLILEQLEANNIKLLGSIGFKKIPEDTARFRVLAEHQSTPLSELIEPMLKKSDNTIADVIYKKLGSTFFNKSASWQDGAKAIQAILEPKTNIAFKKMFIDDGSGLSRYNLVTPTQLVKVLNYAYRNEPIRKVFFESLSHAGIDGTLKYRMPNLKNRLYAKTGNMENSSTLAGYIKTKNQETLAFAIIINSFVDSPKKYHKLQDEICMVLANS